MSNAMNKTPPDSVPSAMDQNEDKGLAFGRFSDEDYDGIIEGNGEIPWWLVLIAAVTIFEAFLWTFPFFGQRYDSVTTTFVSASGKQPWWDWGYYLIMLQIMAVMTGIACIVWIINWRKKKESESKSSHSEGT
jgi:uncharacterized membrane protein